MGEQRYTRLNRLERDLPEGLLVDAAWLAENDYSSPLRAKYVATGRLEQPARSVYRRPRGSLSWQQVVISLQTLLGEHLTIGGRTALDFQGFAHYLAQSVHEVHLYGDAPPPGWLAKLPLPAAFRFHNARRLFPDVPISAFPVTDLNGGAVELKREAEAHFVVQTWGQWDWPIILSTPERALLELLDELPAHESFHQVDMLMDGLANLRPKRMQQLLVACTSVKVKRLFFFFADRHPHAWAKRLDPAAIDLGRGKRMLVRHGKLDKRYQITVPEDLDGAQ
jgi:hypothetical protein